MTNLQSRKRVAYADVQKFLGDNAPQFTGFVPLQAAEENFNTQLSVLDTAFRLQETKSTATTTLKNEKETEIVKFIVPISRKAMRWAQAEENTELHDLFDVEITMLLRLSDAGTLSRVTNIVMNLRANVTDLAGYRITPANISNAEALLAAYTPLIPKPRDLQGISETGTADAKEIIKKIDREVAIMSDLIIGEFTESDPALVAAWRHAKEIGQISVRHTALHVLAQNADHEPLEGVRVLIRELNREDITDINGLADIIKFKPGTFHIDFFIGEELKRTLIEEIEQGESQQIEITL